MFGWMLVSSALAIEPGDLTITEFMAYPNEVPNYSGEWFEVRNNTESTVNLYGLFVSGETWANDGFTVSTSLSLGAGDFAVFGVSNCNNTTTCPGNAYNGGVDVDFVYDRDDLDLNEDGDTISLSMVVGGVEVMIDTVTWDARNWSVRQDYAHQANINASDLEWANDNPANWCSADTPYGERALYGTPGAANQPCDGSNTDADGDGFTEATGDCDDNNPYINPNAVDGVGHYPATGDYLLGEGCCGELDDDANCDGVRDDGILDLDGDLFSPVAGDCDDTNADIHPYQTELDGNGIDDNCNGCVDADEVECLPGESTDIDGDGYTGDDGDCDDLNASIHPGATEVPYDGIDNDCVGGDLIDVDDDGLVAARTGGGDCDDEDPEVGGPVLWYADFDGDGYGDALTTFTSCRQPPGYTTDATDCDDGDAGVNPDAEDAVCDGIDNNCDGIQAPQDNCQDGTAEEPAGCQAVTARHLELWLLALVLVVLRRR